MFCFTQHDFNQSKKHSVVLLCTVLKERQVNRANRGRMLSEGSTVRNISQGKEQQTSLLHQIYQHFLASSGRLHAMKQEAERQFHQKYCDFSNFLYKKKEQQNIFFKKRDLQKP